MKHKLTSRDYRAGNSVEGREIPTYLGLVDCEMGTDWSTQTLCGKEFVALLGGEGFS
jgi:hypothetical protein